MVHDQEALSPNSVPSGNRLMPASTTMGPLNNEPTARKMDRHVADALDQGADLILGGARASGFPTDLYYQPTVLDRVTDEMEVAREETIGPSSRLWSSDWIR